MIKSIEISSYASIRDTIRLPLGHTTLIHGPNMSGKSIICDAIATALTPELPLPIQSPQNSSNAKVLMEFSHPALGSFNLERKFSIARVSHDEEIKFDRSEIRVDGVLRPDIDILTELVSFAYVSAYGGTYSTYGGDLPEEIFFQVASRFLGFIDTNSNTARRAVIDIIERINLRQERVFREIKIIDDTLHIQDWDDSSFIPYTYSGTSGKILLLSDFLLEAATLLSQYRNVLLILDDFPTLIGIDRFFKRYRQLSSPNIQVIMTTLRKDIENQIGADLLVNLEDYQLKNSENRSIKIQGRKSFPRPMTAMIEDIISSYKSGMEDEFIDEFVVPALRALNFKQVRRVPYHGAGEHGFDIQPFHKYVFPGRIAYFGAQVKVRDVSARSSGSGTVNELIDQIKKMLTKKVTDPTTQLKIKVDYALAIISGRLTPDAQQLFDDEFEDNRRIVLWDAQSFANLLYEEGVWPIILSSLEGRKLHQKSSTE